MWAPAIPFAKIYSNRASDFARRIRSRLNIRACKHQRRHCIFRLMNRARIYIYTNIRVTEFNKVHDRTRIGLQSRWPSDCINYINCLYFPATATRRRVYIFRFINSPGVSRSCRSQASAFKEAKSWAFPRCDVRYLRPPVALFPRHYYRRLAVSTTRAEIKSSRFDSLPNVA